MKRIDYIFIHWHRMIRKYQRVLSRLSQTKKAEVHKKLKLKLLRLKKRIIASNKKWKVGLSTAVLSSLMFMETSFAQTSIDIINDSRVKKIPQTSLLSTVDINHDGYDDIAAFSDSKLFILYGEEAPFPDEFDINLVTPGKGIFVSSSHNQTTEVKIATQFQPLKDINGDGINDIAILAGQTEYDFDSKSYILFGSEEGFQDTIDMEEIVSQGDGIEITSIDLYTNRGDRFDSGDINGDGLSDLMLCRNSSVSILFGKKNGFSENTVNWSASMNGVDGCQIINDLGTEDDWRRRSIIPGDLNGDGYDDIIIDAGIPKQPCENCRTSFVGIYGRANFPSVFNASDVDGKNGFRTYVNVNKISLREAGDINGDKLDDFAVAPFSESLDSVTVIIYGRCGNKLYPHNENINKLLKLTDGELLLGKRIFPTTKAIDYNKDGYKDFIFTSYDNFPNFSHKVLLSKSTITPCFYSKIHGNIAHTTDKINLVFAEVYNEELGSFYTSQDGNYEIAVPSTGLFDLSFKHSNKNIFFFKDQMSVHVFKEGDEVIVNNQFEFHSTFDDVAVMLFSGNRARPGFGYNLYIDAINQGTINDEQTAVTLTVPKEFIVKEISDGGKKIGNTISWSSLSIPVLQRQQLTVSGEIDVDVPLGNTLNFFCEANGSSQTDIDLTNNTIFFSTTVTGSYDPNDKTTDTVITPEFVENGEYLDYLIRFQNTGTDTAFTVKVTDTLSHDLQWESFELVSTSHKAIVHRKDSILTFLFNDILLVDSTTNEKDSHGYI